MICLPLIKPLGLIHLKGTNKMEFFSLQRSRAPKYGHPPPPAPSPSTQPAHSPLWLTSLPAIPLVGISGSVGHWLAVDMHPPQVSEGEFIYDIF